MQLRALFLISTFACTSVAFAEDGGASTALDAGHSEIVDAQGANDAAEVGADAGDVAIDAAASAADDAGAAEDDADDLAAAPVDAESDIADEDASLVPEQKWESTPAAALPPAKPDPEIAPIVTGRGPTTPEAPPIAREDRPLVVIGTLLGLLCLLALAYLGGHPRVQAFERKLGVSQVITAGFPFVVLGLVARRPAVGLISDALLADLGPLLRIGLGCIGFVSGFRFSVQFRAAPAVGVVRLAVWAAAVPFVLVAIVSGAVLLLFSTGLSAAALSDPVFIRDAVILGTAGAMTARTSAELFRADDAHRVLSRVLRLEELAGIIGLAIVAAYFRPVAGATWQLPGTAWLLLTIGLGVTLGLMAHLVFRRPQEGPEFVVLTLGTIAFGAGIAGYLRLSPVVVCFIASTCLALLPLPHKDRIRSALRRLERPIYLLSLIAIGALWQIDDWRGWALVPVFCGARFLGKWLGVSLATRYTGLPASAEERQILALSPMGPLAIAIVVNAQLLYPGGSISHIVAAVIGGATLTEVVVQLVSRLGGGSPVAGVASDSPPATWTDPPESTP